MQIIDPDTPPSVAPLSRNPSHADEVDLNYVQNLGNVLDQVQPIIPMPVQDLDQAFLDTQGPIRNIERCRPKINYALFNKTGRKK